MPQQKQFVPQEKPQVGDRCLISGEIFDETVVPEKRLLTCTLCSRCFIRPRPFDSMGNPKKIDPFASYFQCPSGYHTISKDELHTVTMEEWDCEHLDAEQLYNMGLVYAVSRTDKAINLLYFWQIMQRANAQSMLDFLKMLVSIKMHFDDPWFNHLKMDSYDAGICIFIGTRFKSIREHAFELARSKNSAYGTYLLADFYGGHNRFYYEAVHADCRQALCELGQFHMNIYYLTRAADLGEIEAHKHLWRLYEHNDKKFQYHLKIAAENCGDPEAQYMLSTMSGYNQKYWFTRALENGSIHAIKRLEEEAKLAPTGA